MCGFQFQINVYLVTLHVFKLSPINWELLVLIRDLFLRRLSPLILDVLDVLEQYGLAQSARLSAGLEVQLLKVFYGGASLVFSGQDSFSLWRCVLGIFSLILCNMPQAFVGLIPVGSFGPSCKIGPIDSYISVLLSTYGNDFCLYWYHRNGSSLVLIQLVSDNCPSIQIFLSQYKFCCRCPEKR